MLSNSELIIRQKKEYMLYMKDSILISENNTVVVYQKTRFAVGPVELACFRSY